MMKILFVNNFRGRGGGEEFLRDLLPGLAAKGVQVGLVCRPGTPLLEMFQGSSIRLYPTDRSGIAALTSPFTIARIIRKGGYEIVNIQRGHDIIQSWVAALLSFRRPVLIYTPQVPEFLRSRFLLKRMHRIATISRYIRDKIIAFAPSLADRIRIIHYGIDVSSFSPSTDEPGGLRKRWGLPPNAKIIGTVGDLWKNQIEFLDSLVEIRRRVPGARFALVATESLSHDVVTFKDRAVRLGLADAVIWAGRLSKAEMKSFYADINVAVSTHRNEGFGIWVLEALAMGKPVVAFQEGGITDSLEGCPSGILVAGGPADMANAVSALLADQARLDAAAVEGPRWVADRFARERMVSEYRDFFEDLAGTPKKLSILQLISKNDKYGAQRIFLDQVKALSDLGNRVIVVGRGNEGYVPDVVRSLGVEYHGLPLSSLRDIYFLRRLVKQYTIDVIHTTLDRADHIGLLLSWITGKPVVSTMMVPRYHLGFRFADHVVVLSRMQRQLLIRKGIRPEKISVIRPGIDVERFANPDVQKRDAWKQRIGRDERSVVFCHIASLIPRKAHAVSIDLVHECKKRGENPLLIIIGDPLSGEYYESLVKKIADRGLEQNVLFTGWTSEVPEIIAVSNFTILPSENEALGVVLMEGMAAGTPIIAREGEGGAELIEEQGCGFLYAPGNGVAPIADQVVALVHDSARVKALSDECVRAAQDFSLDRFGEKLAGLYRKCLRG